MIERTVRLAFHFNLLHATNLTSVFRYCKLFVLGYKHICWCKCLITQTTYQLPSLVQFTFVIFTGAFVDYIQMSLYFYKFGANPQQSHLGEMGKDVIVSKKFNFISHKGIPSFILYLNPLKI